MVDVALSSVPMFPCGSLCVLRLLFMLRLCSRSFSFPAMKHGEDRGHEDQGGHGRAEQAADDRSAQRRILLAAIAQPERHRHHADDHGQRRHADRAKTGGACFNGSQNRVAVFGQARLGERDHQDAVGRGHAHAHDGAHQRGHAERGVGEEEEQDDTRQRRRQRR